MRKAFTLIELLVVVLIMGILAAIALPQYQKAVEKAKAVNMISLIKPISEAVQVYYLNNNSAPTDIEDLDISLSAQQKQKYWCNNVATCSNEDFGFQLYEASNGVKGVLAMKTAGKYRGGGFMIFHDIGSKDYLKTNTLYCIERIAGDNEFTLTPGAYCQKIFQGGTPTDPINARVYLLP